MGPEQRDGRGGEKRGGRGVEGVEGEGNEGSQSHPRLKNPSSATAIRVVPDFGCGSSKSGIWPFFSKIRPSPAPAKFPAGFARCQCSCITFRKSRIKLTQLTCQVVDLQF